MNRLIGEEDKNEIRHRNFVCRLVCVCICDVLFYFPVVCIFAYCNAKNHNYQEISLVLCLTRHTYIHELFSGWSKFDISFIYINFSIHAYFFSSYCVVIIGFD